MLQHVKKLIHCFWKVENLEFLVQNMGSNSNLCNSLLNRCFSFNKRGISITDIFPHSFAHLDQTFPPGSKPLFSSVDIWILGFGPRFVLKACQLVIFLKYSEIIKKNRRTLIRLLQNQKINHPDYNLKEKLCQPHYYKYLSVQLYGCNQVRNPISNSGSSQRRAASIGIHCLKKDISV